ncbi:MAG TPA: L,D-transpeptidase family protein [Methyloceanibacter sp.]|nr:L,D-transpeptidase family protein [Methyloceanibacter sp.]
MRTGRLKDAAVAVARRTSPTIFAVLGIAALALAVGASLPAEAKKRQGSAKRVEEPLPDPANGEPMTLVVSLNNQKVEIYRGTTLVTSSKVSTGMRGYATKAGVFSILEKKRRHHSNLYSGAPMPYMQRLTWSGTALHAGVVPGYPASHGCIRLPFSFAPKLFGITTVGEHVVVARDSVAPEIVEHEILFQPLPPPPPPTLVKQDHPPQRQSGLDTPPAERQQSLPVILAKADIGGVTIDRTPAVSVTAFENGSGAARSQVATASTQAKAAQIVPSDSSAADSASLETQVEDTRTHAFDPFEGMPAQTAKQGDRGTPAEAAGATYHALDEDGGPDPAVAAAPAEVPAQPQAAELTSPTEPVSAAAELEVAPVALDVKAGAAEAASVVAEVAPREPAPAPIAAPMAPTETTLPAPAAADASDEPLSPVALKLTAGAKAVAVQAAEPRSTAPLRILVTRRTQRDRIVGVQRILSEMGYLMPVDFDGTLGKATVTAIKEFQKANELPETGTFNDDLVKKVYEVAGKEEPPVGHLFVRQEFGRVFDAPVSFRDPETPLGTYLFTAMKFEPGETKARWMAVSVQGDDPKSALDRIEIPSDIRQKISERLTPGSSLIIGDIAINSASLPKGADFLVWAKDTPAKITTTSVDGDISQPRPKKKRKRTVRRPSYNYTYTQPRTFGRSPWPW